MRAHLLIENTRDEIVLDEDVNDVRVDHAWVQWKIWRTLADKRIPEEHEFRLDDAKRVELTPCRHRLVKATDSLQDQALFE